MITVTLEKKEYDNLLEYKEAFNNKTVIISSYDWTYGGAITTIKAISTDDALKTVLVENKLLREEIEKLKSKKWWQKI
jgi:hypothetical protein